MFDFELFKRSHGDRQSMVTIFNEMVKLSKSEPADIIINMGDLLHRQLEKYPEYKRHKQVATQAYGLVYNFLVNNINEESILVYRLFFLSIAFKNFASGEETAEKKFSTVFTKIHRVHNWSQEKLIKISPDDFIKKMIMKNTEKTKNPDEILSLFKNWDINSLKSIKPDEYSDEIRLLIAVFRKLVNLPFETQISSEKLPSHVTSNLQKPTLTEPTITSGHSLSKMAARVTEHLQIAELAVLSENPETALKNLYLSLKTCAGVVSSICYDKNCKSFAKLMPALFSTDRNTGPAKSYENDIKFVPGSGYVNFSKDFITNLTFQLAIFDKFAYIGVAYVDLLYNMAQYDRCLLTARSLADLYSEIPGFEGLAIKFQLKTANTLIKGNYKKQGLGLLKDVLDRGFETVSDWEPAAKFFQRGTTKDIGEHAYDNEDLSTVKINFSKQVPTDTTKKDLYELAVTILEDAVPEYAASYEPLLDVSLLEKMLKVPENEIGNMIEKLQQNIKNYTAYLHNSSSKIDINNLKLQAVSNKDSVLTSTPSRKPAKRVNGPQQPVNPKKRIQPLRLRNSKVEQPRASSVACHYEKSSFETEFEGYDLDKCGINNDMCSRLFSLTAGLHDFSSRRTVAASKFLLYSRNLESPIERALVLDTQKSVKSLTECSILRKFSWVTVSISVIDQTSDQEFLYLHVLRLDQSSNDIDAIVKVKRSNTVDKMHKLVAKTTKSLSLTERKAYWKMRFELDSELKNFVNNELVQNLVSTWRFLFKFCSQEQKSFVQKLGFSERVSDCLSLLLVAWEDYSASERIQVLLQIFKSDNQSLDENNLIKITGKFNQFHLSEKTKIIKRDLLLVLDNEICTLPIEKSEFLTKSYKIISRMTSLSEAVESFESSKVTYSIDKLECHIQQQTGLEQTKAKISSWFRQLFERDESPSIVDPLRTESPLVYCGHGTGTRWVNEMHGQPVQLKGLPILMGCSSARLNDYWKRFIIEFRINFHTGIEIFLRI